MVGLRRHDTGFIYPIMFADGQVRSSRGIVDVCLLLLTSQVFDEVCYMGP